jgi:copper chaperone CopZ
MLLYQTSFPITGMEDLEKVNKLKKALLQKEGVTKVEITRPNSITITYNPTRIIPSVLSSIISSLGFNPPRG